MSPISVRPSGRLRASCLERFGSRRLESQGSVSGVASCPGSARSINLCRCRVGLPARTLRDAANYIKKLPQSEHDSPEWRLAIQMLIDAAENRGPMLFAKMGMLRATNQNVERVFNPSRKESHWGRRKLKRDT
jgi:hypothetical protein